MNKPQTLAMSFLFCYPSPRFPLPPFQERFDVAVVSAVAQFVRSTFSFLSLTLDNCVNKAEGDSPVEASSLEQVGIQPSCIFQGFLNGRQQWKMHKKNIFKMQFNSV